MSQQRVYFAHPKNTYGTQFEVEMLELIRARFPDWEIVNPSDPEHQERCEETKRIHGTAMPYFTETVVPTCQAVVVLTFLDGKWGAGVYAEACVMWSLERPVFVIGVRGTIDGPISSRSVLNPLTRAETQERIKYPYLPSTATG